MALFKLDNGKTNLAEDVRHARPEFIGCIIDPGPAQTPDDRPILGLLFDNLRSIAALPPLPFAEWTT